MSCCYSLVTCLNGNITGKEDKMWEFSAKRSMLNFIKRLGEKALNVVANSVSLSEPGSVN